MTTTVPPSGLPLNVRVRASPAASGPRHGPGPAGSGFRVDPLGHLASHEDASAALEHLFLASSQPSRQGVVRLHDAQGVVGDDDEIDERVEGVFQQPMLADHFLEQLQVLDDRDSWRATSWRQFQALSAVSSGDVSPSRTSVPSARRQPRSGATMDGPRRGGAARGVECQAERRRLGGSSAGDPGSGGTGRASDGPRATAPAPGGRGARWRRAAHP